MRLRVRAARRVLWVATLTIAFAAVAWTLARSGPPTGSPAATWPAAGGLGWPLALLL